MYNAGKFKRNMRGVPGDYRVVIDFGGIHRNPGKVGTLVGTDPVGVIIETGDAGKIVAVLLAELSEYDDDSRVELFTHDNDSYGYWDISSIHIHPKGQMVMIAAGAYIEG